jgi:hypothetical protein
MTPEQEQDRMTDISEQMIHMDIMQDVYYAAAEIMFKYNMTYAAH